MSWFLEHCLMFGRIVFKWGNTIMHKNVYAVLSCVIVKVAFHSHLQYIPRNMHTVFALLCFVVVIHWLIFPYPSGLLHWHCGNLTIAPVPAKQPWWIWINTSCEFIMNDCITTTKQSTTKPCAYFLGYTVHMQRLWVNILWYPFMYFVQSSKWNGNTSDNGDDKDYKNLGFQIDSRESLRYQTRNDCFWKCHLKFLIDIYDIMNQD